MLMGWISTSCKDESDSILDSLVTASNCPGKDEQTAIKGGQTALAKETNGHVAHKVKVTNASVQCKIL